MRRDDSPSGCLPFQTLFANDKPTNDPHLGPEPRDRTTDQFSPLSSTPVEGRQKQIARRTGSPFGRANSVGRHGNRHLRHCRLRHLCPCGSRSLLQMADFAANTAANQCATFRATLRLAGLHQLRARAERHDYSTVNRTGTGTPADPFLRGMWQHSNRSHSSQVAPACSK